MHMEQLVEASRSYSVVAGLPLRVAATAAAQRVAPPCLDPTREQAYLPMKGLAGFYIPPPLTAKKFTIAGEEYIECECIKEAGALVRKESKHTGGLFNHGLTSDCRALWWTMFMRKLISTVPCTCSPQHWHCGDRTRLLHIH